MSVHICESSIFGTSWRTAEVRQMFEETTRVEDWLMILSVLAQTQADYELIPREAAEQIQEACHGIAVDKEFLAEVESGFVASNHSLIGFIRAVQNRCGKLGGEWLCYGATVQDVTDTQLMCTLAKLQKHLINELELLKEVLIGMAVRYRGVYMLGRTHGQVGLPITFGYKAACWLDEINRHLERLAEVGNRISVGQLCGGVGSLSSLGQNALQIQAEFMSRLGLKVPSISWTNTRDRLAEWMNLLALMASTGDRIGHEIYNLQRPEIAELNEGFVEGTIGSITMPQKRNPEISEHLGTLARVVRHDSSHMLESLVHDHERDGRSWKGEWWIVPPACMATAKIITLLRRLLGELQVNEQRMLNNIHSADGFIFAESVMLSLAPKMGKQSAHMLVYSIAADAKSSGSDFESAVKGDVRIRQHLGSEEVDGLFDLKHSVGHCDAMIDQVLERT
uniref:Fumarate lyase n=1 Tax=Alteromonadaceae bacterium PE-TB08W TaxID=1199097 RepID=A0A3G9ELW0_9ALTE|nr:fumarate lyase [Alteromonadaceae bacterium PE-TB08W]